MNGSNNHESGPFRGIWPVLVTPYTEDLNIDVPAYRQLIEWHLEMGCHGIYALCLSSEMYHLSRAEQILLVREAIKTVNGRVPVAVTGNVDRSIHKQIEFCKFAHGEGADVIMLTVPSTMVTQDEIQQYFLEMAKKTDFPLGIYECPYPRHYHLNTQVIEKLGKTGRFYAYKETSCEIDKIKSISERLKDTNLSLLQANIPFLIEALLVGAQGSMNVAANWLPDLVCDVYEKVKEGLVDEAKSLHQTLCTLELAQRSIHPAGVKYLISKRGLDIRPLTRLDRKLTNEEKKSIDCLATAWFETKDHTYPSYFSEKKISSVA